MLLGGNISNRIANLTQSQSLAMAARCQELRQQGGDVVGMIDKMLIVF